MASKRAKQADMIEAGQQGIVMLLRHAHAAWPKPEEKDFDRALNDDGRAEALTMAETLKALGIAPDRIICSPAVRCRETLAPIASSLAGNPVCDFDQQLYDGGLPSYVDMIADLDPSKTVLIIGHNPMIEDVFVWMANGQEGDFLGYPTAGLAVFRHDPEIESARNWKLMGFYQP